MAIGAGESGTGLNPYVKLVSSDGHEFYVKKSFAVASKKIKADMENGMDEIQLNIESHTVQLLCKFLSYKVKYANYMGEVPIPEFPIPPEMALQILMAVHDLDVV